MNTVSADASTSVPQPAEITPESNQSLPLKKLTNETGSFQEQPCVIFADNHFYVAYQSNKTGNYDIFIKKYDLNWIDFTEEQITTNQSNQWSPSIVFTDKYLYIAYYSNETGNLDIFVKKYDSDLNPMGKKKQITKDKSYQLSPSIAFVKDYLYIAYGSNETGDYDIFIEKYDLNLTPAGEGKKQITFEGNNQSAPSIIFADSCFYIAYCTFEDGIDWNIAIKKYGLGQDRNECCINLDHRKSHIDFLDGHQVYPSIVFVDNISYITYTSKEDLKLYIFVKRFTSDLKYFEKSPEITNETYQDRVIRPSITSVENNFYVVYSSFDETGYSNIFMKKFDKNFFVEREAPPEITKKNPSIVFANNTFYVAYSSNESNRGNYDIFVKQYYRDLTPKGSPKKVTNESFDEDNPSIHWRAKANSQ
jgi:hypothetical protein